MIHVLDEALVNKIAAGEVIDRPMNIVKELVENAIDARAQRVLIDIEDDLIRVSDDGVGMQKEDLEKCIIRNATSKIASLEDLEKVKSLGFRGEALASIAAVSRLTISSKYKDELEGNELLVEGGVVVSCKPFGRSQGTTVEVKDLFFNTPVRKKFLDHKENDRIIGYVEKLALGTITNVKLRVKGKMVLDVSSLDIKDRIAQVYGSDIAKEMVAVDLEDGDVRVRGFVSRPTIFRKDRSKQVFFVNGRLVESDEIRNGMYDAFKSMLFVGKHPIAVLALKIKGVDANVHPTKRIVKFSDPGKVLETVKEGIMSVFKEETVVFEVQDKFIPTNTEATLATLQERYMRKKKADEARKLEQRRFSPDTQKGLVEGESESGYVRLPKFRLIGNVAKTFFLAEGEQGLLLIDQHVVEERINYEKFMKEFMNEDVEVQELLQPVLVEFTQREAVLARRHLEKLKEFGYYLEEFGDDTFRLSKVPVIFNKVKDASLLKDLLVDFKEDEKEKTITMMACRNAIKAGDDVTVSQMRSLLKKLDKCDLPFTCPHGRPTIVKLTVDDMEKMFKRKGA